jgi:LacI family transcriptional regulator
MKSRAEAEAAVLQRPTMADLARAAGVSLATVDRVLNDREGVRADTIRKVQDAITRIGYVRDLAAANLARQRNYRFAFLLPETESEFITSLVNEIERTRETVLVDRTLLKTSHYPVENSMALTRALDVLIHEEWDGVAVMAEETPQSRDAIRRLCERGVPVVALVSDLPSTRRLHFVGIDNRAAGRTAGVLMGRFLGPGGGRVAVFSHSMRLRESVERRLGFDEVIARDFPNAEVLPSVEGHGDLQMTQQVIRNLLQSAPDLAGIYSVGTGNRALTAALRAAGRMGKILIIAHELTPFSRTALLQGEFAAVINQNLGHVVRSAIRLLRAAIDGASINSSQEQIRIEILLRENLPREDPVLGADPESVGMSAANHELNMEFHPRSGES